MNKNLRLSLIAIACSLAITACSSDNKGATRYENLVKNKTEEATKRAEEKAKRAQESDTAKKLADLEKKQKELEAELAKKQNGNTAAPSVSGNVPSNVITPSTPAKSKDVEEAKPTEKKEPEVKASVGKVLSTEEAKKALEGAFKDNGKTNNNTIKLSGSSISTDSLTATNIDKNTTSNLNELIIDGTTITLYSPQFLANTAATETEVGVGDINDKNITGKKGGLPKTKYGSNLEHMRYGFYTKDGKTNLYVQGLMTPVSSKADDEKAYAEFNWYGLYKNGEKNVETVTIRSLPTEGTYEYKGTAFYGSNNNYKEYAVTSYADFTEKKVKVDVALNDSHLIFGGNIKDNTFSGTHNGIVSKGAFFGTKGTDMGGVFYQTAGEDKGHNGVFGATQTNCRWGSCQEHSKQDAIKDFKISN